MADLGDVFDPSAVPERSNDFPLLPEQANVQMQIVGSQLKMKDAGGGEVTDIRECETASLGLEVEVATGGKFMIFLNIRNPSEQAQSISLRELADIFNATQTPPSSNSDDLHFKPFIGDIRVSKSKNPDYSDKNVIRKYRPMSGAAPKTVARTATAVAGKATPAGNTAAKTSPWRR